LKRKKKKRRRRRTGRIPTVYGENTEKSRGSLVLIKYRLQEKLFISTSTHPPQFTTLGYLSL
jgi:hypothetical protein